MWLASDVLRNWLGDDVYAAFRVTHEVGRCLHRGAARRRRRRCGVLPARALGLAVLDLLVRVLALGALELFEELGEGNLARLVEAGPRGQDRVRVSSRVGGARRARDATSRCTHKLQKSTATLVSSLARVSGRLISNEGPAEKGESLHLGCAAINVLTWGARGSALS